MEAVKEAAGQGGWFRYVPIVVVRVRVRVGLGLGLGLGLAVGLGLGWACGVRVGCVGDVLVVVGEPGRHPLGWGTRGGSSAGRRHLVVRTLVLAPVRG